MNDKINALTKKTNKYQIVLPPGQFYEYHPNNKTYLYKEKEGMNYLADNPYILEYLVYNEREEDLGIISNLVYPKEEVIRMKFTETQPTFLTEKVDYILEFETSKEELPIFKIFLEHFAYNRINNVPTPTGIFFPWEYSLFSNYAKFIAHKLTEEQVKKFHTRIVDFQKRKFPEEALRSLFGNYEDK